MMKMIKPGQCVLRRYVSDECFAQGGEASLYKATDQQTGSTVVVKRLDQSPGDAGYATGVERFRRMAQIRLGHPNVVDPLDYGEENGDAFLILPFFEGCNLEHHIAAKGGKLPVVEAVAIAVEIARGLQALHDNGVIHCDVKPANVLVTVEGRIMLTDLGICRIIGQPDITNGAAIQGSPCWMTPEQFDRPGSEDHRTDLYSSGAVLYYMSTGTMSATGNDNDAIRSYILYCDIPDIRRVDPSIPEHVGSACMRLLAKRPDDRFQSAEEFIQAIQRNALPAAGSYCLSCGYVLQQGSRFCCVCGVSADSHQSQPAQCLACGTPVNGQSVCQGCNRLFSAAGHQLRVVEGPLTGMFFLIPEGTFYVGRQELSPRDCHISRRHFSVNCLNGHVYLQDAGSTNSTYVDGQVAVRPTQLSPGQKILIAGNTAVYTRN